jgi:hypothetical protein
MLTRHTEQGTMSDDPVGGIDLVIPHFVYPIPQRFMNVLIAMLPVVVPEFSLLEGIPKVLPAYPVVLQ